MNFHETICGRRFFDAQLPHLIKALERIADGLTRPKMSLPHGMTIEPNFLHDLYYGEYEPSVFKEQDKKQQVLNHTVSAQCLTFAVLRGLPFFLPEPEQPHRTVQNECKWIGMVLFSPILAAAQLSLRLASWSKPLYRLVLS